METTTFQPKSKKYWLQVIRRAKPLPKEAIIWDQVLIQCEKQEKSITLSYLTDPAKGTSVTHHYYEYPLAKQHQNRALLYRYAKWEPISTMNGEIVLALRLFAYGSTAWLPDLILDAAINPLRPEHEPTPKKHSVRKFLVNISTGDKQVNTATTSNEHLTNAQELTTTKLEQSQAEASESATRDLTLATTTTDLNYRPNPRLSISLSDLHIRRLIKPAFRGNEEADPVFDRIRAGANNVYLRVKEGSLSFYYVLTRNEPVIRQNKCMVIQYQELVTFFVHVRNVSQKYRQLYKFLLGTLGHNKWIPIKKYTNVFITSEPMPTRYHFEVLSQVTLEPPDNVCA